MLLNTLLNIKMNTPTLFGWFHILCLLLTIVLIIIIYKYKNKVNEKLIFGLYGFGALALEIIKQYMWNFDFIDGKLVMNYGWYNFPFQLCSTPMYVSIVLFFLNESKLKKCLINYLSYFTIISALAVSIYPSLVFNEYVLVNIQTMYLHCGSFILSIYLILSNKVDKSIKGVIDGFKVFIFLLLLALMFDVLIYNIGIKDEFNMFYISPYYINPMPIYSYLQNVLPYPLYLMIYILSIFFGAFIVNRIISIKKDN